MDEPDAAVLLWHVCHGLQPPHPAAAIPGRSRHVPARRGRRRATHRPGPVECQEEERELQRGPQQLAWRQCPRFYPHLVLVDPRNQRNGHSASLWKDYYLDHKDHIDTWINMCLEKEKSHHRRPPPDAVKREFSPARLPLSAPVASKKRKHSSPSTSATPVPLIGRSTLNSLSVPQPVYNDQMPAPNSELKIPDPPTRSPSPPTRVIPQGRGNKYTEEDRHFFLQFISWRLKQDPSLTRNDLCNMLAEKVPSFRSYLCLMFMNLFLGSSS